MNIDQDYNIRYLKAEHFPSKSKSDSGKIMPGSHTQYYQLTNEFKINPESALFISLDDKNIYLSEELPINNNTIYMNEFTGSNFEDFLIYKIPELLAIVNLNVNDLIKKNSNNPKKLRLLNLSKNSFFVKVFLSKHSDKEYYLKISSIQKPIIIGRKSRQDRTETGKQSEHIVILALKKIIKPEYLSNINFIGAEKAIGSTKEDVIIEIDGNNIICEVKLIYKDSSYFFYKIVNKFDKNRSHDLDMQLFNNIAKKLSNGKAETLSEYIMLSTEKYKKEIEDIVDEILLNYKNPKYTEKDIKLLRKEIADTVSYKKETEDDFILVGFPGTVIEIWRNLGDKYNFKNVLLYREGLTKTNISKDDLNIDAGDFLKSGRLPDEFRKIGELDKDLMIQIVFEALNCLLQNKNIDLYCLVDKEGANYLIYIIDLSKNNILRQIINDNKYLLKPSDLIRCIVDVSLKTFGTATKSIDKPAMKIGIEYKLNKQFIKSLPHIIINSNELKIN